MTKIIIKSKYIDNISIEDNYDDGINVSSIKVDEYYIMKFYVKFEPNYELTMKINWTYNSKRSFENIYLDESNYSYKYIYILDKSESDEDELYIRDE